MATDFIKIQENAKKDIVKNGSDLTIIKKIIDYDPETGAVAETTEEMPTKGIGISFNIRDIDDTVIRKGDCRFMIPGDIELEGTETVIFKSRSYVIQNIIPEIQGNVQLFQYIHIR